MDWKRFLTPAEPRVHYAFFVGMATFLGMLVLVPVWRDNALVSVAALAVVLVAAMALVKVFMTRGVR